MTRIPPVIRRFIVGGGIAVAVLLVCFGVFCYYVVTKSFPKVEGTIGDIDVSAPVSIFRDVYGVPHVMAATEEDGYVALGFLHAQDRLFQMDLARRAGEGRLSEIFGSSTIPIDAMFRTIGIPRVAWRILATMPAGTRKILDAYSRGVNAYIAQHRRTMPVEFDALGYKPNQWQPVDCVIMMRMMAWELNFGWLSDITAQDVINKVGVKAALELFPGFPADAPTIFRDERVVAKGTMPGSVKDTARARAALENPMMPGVRGFVEANAQYHRLINAPGQQSGSNSWAVGSSRTVHGKPILCNDPHLIITSPSRWYQVHINAGAVNVAGMSVPGLPAVMIGRNNAVSWGLTNAMLDDCDFVVEKIDSTSPTRYLSRGTYKQMRVRADTIHIKDTLDVVINVYETDHGPIISAVHSFMNPSLFFNAPVPDNPKPVFAGAAVAVHWMGHELSDELTALLKASRARSGRDVADAMVTAAVPAQNVVYADTMGNIGYVYAGRIPVREMPYPGMSTPVSGAQDNMIWNSFIAGASTPRFTNPKSGMIVTANNRISSDLPASYGNLWEPPSRSMRIIDLLESHPMVGEGEMKKFQNDVISPHALDATRFILAAFPDSATQQPLVKQALTYFANWDGSMAKEEIAASVFNVWLMHMFEALWRDRLGSPIFEEYMYLQDMPHRAITAVLRTPQSDWFDDPRTPQREVRDEMIRRCLLEALQELTGRFNSTEMKRWQWGELHSMTFKHALGVKKPLDKVLNIGPLPAAGSLTTINNAGFEYLHRYESTLGPSMRMICDMSTARMLTIISGGASGQPFSPHYSDQTPLWRNGGYLEMTLDPTEIPQPGWTKLVLEK